MTEKFLRCADGTRRCGSAHLQAVQGLWISARLAGMARSSSAATEPAPPVSHLEARLNDLRQLAEWGEGAAVVRAPRGLRRALRVGDLSGYVRSLGSSAPVAAVKDSAGARRSVTGARAEGASWPPKKEGGRSSRPRTRRHLECLDDQLRFPVHRHGLSGPGAEDRHADRRVAANGSRFARSRRSPGLRARWCPPSSPATPGLLHRNRHQAETGAERGPHLRRSNGLSTVVEQEREPPWAARAEPHPHGSRRRVPDDAPTRSRGLGHARSDLNTSESGPNVPTPSPFGPPPCSVSDPLARVRFTANHPPIALAHRREYDMALVLSQDQDLSETRRGDPGHRAGNNIGGSSFRTAPPAMTVGGSTRPTGSGSSERSTTRASTAGTTPGSAKGGDRSSSK